MKLDEDMPLPFPLDEQQLGLVMETLASDNYVTSIPGTDRYELLDTLVNHGVMAKKPLKLAGWDVYQFSVTEHGMGIINEQK